MKAKFLTIITISVLISLASLGEGSTFFYEDFENSEQSALWTSVKISGNSDWSLINGLPYGGFSGTNNSTKNACFYSYNYNSFSAILISPEINLADCENPVLNFSCLLPAWAMDQDTLKIFYRINPEANWIQIGTVYSNISCWRDFAIVIPDNSSQLQIGFLGISGYGYGIGIDNIIITDGSACNNVKNFYIENVKETSARFSWTFNPEIISYQIEYGLHGFTINTGQRITDINNNFVQLNNLNGNTSYDIYIRTICSEGVSTWDGPYSFTTKCVIELSLPYNESFENNLNPLECWQISYANQNFPSENQIIVCSDIAYSGEKSFRFSSLGVGSPYDQLLISPLLNVPTNTEFSFYYRTIPGSQEIFRIGYSQSTTNPLSSVIWTDNITNADNTWKKYSSILPENTKYVIIHYRSIYQYYLYIDNIRFGMPLNCDAPQNPILASLESDHAIIEITNHQNVLYGEYGLHGFTKGQGIFFNIYDSLFYINNLQPFTEYDLYFVGNCEGYLIYSEVLTFRTLGICPEIESITCMEITINKAVIQWTSKNEYVTYNIEWGPSGFEKGTGTIIQNSYTNSITLLPLNPATSYDIYIQAYCDIYNNFSDWSEAFTFTTLPKEDDNSEDNNDNVLVANIMINDENSENTDTFENQQNSNKPKAEIKILNKENYFCNQQNITAKISLEIKNIDTIEISQGTIINIVLKTKTNNIGIFDNIVIPETILPGNSIIIEITKNFVMSQNSLKLKISFESTYLALIIEDFELEFVNIIQKIEFENVEENYIITNNLPIQVNPVFTVKPSNIEIKEILWSDNNNQLNRWFYNYGNYTLTINTEYCSTTAELSIIHQDANQNDPQEFGIYPNSDNNEFVVVLPKNPARTFVFDSSGKMVFDKTIYENIFTLNLSYLSSGIYHVKVLIDGKTITKKIFIN